jgi:hypothetical protein
MKPLFSLLFVACSVALAQDYKMEPAGAPPSDLQPAFASLMASPGYKVLASNGSVFCEIWFRSSMPQGKKSTEDSVTFNTIPHGALMGAIRFPAQGADRRGQPIKAGTYTLRYSNYPVNGDHLGVAPQRDFLVMTPVAEDKDPNATPAFEDLMKMSRLASGTPHPAVLSLEPPASGASTPSLTKEGDHDWSLAVKIGDTPVALIVVGKAEA